MINTTAIIVGKRQNIEQIPVHYVLLTRHLRSSVLPQYGDHLPEKWHENDSYCCSGSHSTPPRYFEISDLRYLAPQNFNPYQ